MLLAQPTAVGNAFEPTPALLELPPELLPLELLLELPPELLPRSECLKDVVERMLPYWESAIVADLRAGRRPQHRQHRQDANSDTNKRTHNRASRSVHERHVTYSLYSGYR